MNASQRRIAFRTVSREFVPGLSVLLPTGKTAAVLEVWKDNHKAMVSVKRGDNRRVSIAARELALA